jgi:hypothetical protein
MSTLGKAVIEFSADTAKFTGDVGRAAAVFNRNMAAMERGIESLRTAITGVLAIGGLGALAKSAIDAGEELNKLSQKAGISVEALSGLKHGARLADVDMQGLTVGLKEFNKSIVEAGDKGSKTGQIFTALGVDLTRGPEVALKQVAQRFAEMQDGSEKTTLAVNLFGKAGQDMIPWLNQGADGLERAAQQAQALGLTMSAEQAQRFEQFNDNMKTMGMLAEVVGVNIANLVVPGINSMTQNLITAAEKGNLFWQVMMEGAKFTAAAMAALSAKDSPLDRFATFLFQQDERMRSLREGANVWPGAAAGASANKPAGSINSAALSRALAGGSTSTTPAKDPRLTAAEIIQRQIGAANDFSRALGEEQAAVQAITEARLKDADAIKRQLDPTIELAEQTEKIADLVNRGMLTSEQGDAFLDVLTTKLLDAQGAFDTLKDKGKEDLDELKRAIEGWGRQFSRTMADMVIESEYSFDRIRDLFRDLLKEILAAQIQKRFTDQVVKAGGGLLDKAIGAIGTAIGGWVGGGTSMPPAPIPMSAAAGGDVFAGMPTLVGEHGPELMVPDVSGQIIPNGGLGGVSIYATYNFGSNISRAELRQQVEQGNARLRQDIAHDLASNGPLRKQIKASA